ncbi:PQQ-dependent sugar dehydrogenase [Albirhodobacter sp. R86504]|uniref:PQQ-dependent sugar dehydrogenase n=1 Tax=Albirhodobacter sp. R86504 TaxID=3093848 RepID=UPI00367319A6
MAPADLKPLTLGSIAVVAALLASPISAQSVNAGDRAANPRQPFDSVAVTTFASPWAIAFLPDGRMLVTEKAGAVHLVGQDGEKISVGGIPKVAASGQNGLLDIAVAPDFDQSGLVYLSLVAPDAGGGTLQLVRAKLKDQDGVARLADVTAIWSQTPAGGRGQPGGIIAFDPQGEHLFLTVGDRMEPATAQDPDMARGKVMRMRLDGSVPSDNPVSGGNEVRSLTWTTGHRNPYGLAFNAEGDLWLHEMGPRGGDEFNRIVEGQNYGWPLVSNGENYNGTPIPNHDTRPEFAAPAVYWTPVIAPAGLTFYGGQMFADWQGSALIGALAGQALVRVEARGEGRFDEAERWDMGARIRDVAVAPDGAVWVIEDARNGALRRLTPAP